MHEKDPATREKQFDEGRRFIDLAQAMGVKYVRMFGDKIPEGEPKDEVMKRVVDGFQQMAAYAKPAGVTVLIESHGDFTHSADLEDILTRVDSPQFALLWDAHHSFVAGEEKPGGHLREARASGSATRTSRTRSPRAPDRPLRAHRHGRGAGEGAGQGPGLARLQGLLLLRVGEEVAPRDRGAGGRVPALREGRWASTWPAAGVKPS